MNIVPDKYLEIKFNKDSEDLFTFAAIKQFGEFLSSMRSVDGVIYREIYDDDVFEMRV